MQSHATPTSDEASAWARMANIRKIIQQFGIFFYKNSALRIKHYITTIYK